MSDWRALIPGATYRCVLPALGGPRNTTFSLFIVLLTTYAAFGGIFGYLRLVYFP